MRTRRRILRSVLLTIAGTLAWGGTEARAALVTLEVAGTLSSVDPHLQHGVGNGLFDVGDLFSIVMYYEAETSDSDAAPTLGSYLDVSPSMTLAITTASGVYTATAGGLGRSVNMAVFNDHEFSDDGLSFGSETPYGSVLDINGYRLDFVFVRMTGADTRLLASDALPQTADELNETLSHISSRTLVIGFDNQNTGTRASISGSINSPAYTPLPPPGPLPVPEPSGLLLFGLGSAALLARRSCGWRHH